MIKIAIARSRKTFIELCEAERLNRSQVLQIKNHSISSGLFVNNGISSLYKADVKVYYNAKDECRKTRKIVVALRDYLAQWQASVDWVELEF